MNRNLSSDQNPDHLVHIGGYTTYLHKHHNLNKPLWLSSWSNYSNQWHVPLQGHHVRAIAYLNFPHWSAIFTCSLSQSRLKVFLHLPIDVCYAIQLVALQMNNYEMNKWLHIATALKGWVQKQFPVMILGSSEFCLAPAVSRFAELLFLAWFHNSVS